MRSPYSILVHDLLAIEIKILFLKLKIALNLNFKVTKIMDRNGTWNSGYPYKIRGDICPIVGSQRSVITSDKLSHPSHLSL